MTTTILCLQLLRSCKPVQSLFLIPKQYYYNNNNNNNNNRRIIFSSSSLSFSTIANKNKNVIKPKIRSSSLLYSSTNGSNGNPSKNNIRMINKRDSFTSLQRNHLQVVASTTSQQQLETEQYQGIEQEEEGQQKQEEEEEEVEQTMLLHPNDFLPKDDNDKYYIPYPKSLSPSSIKEFQNCPQSFFFQYILGIKQPTNTALMKGSICHKALEQLFDIEPSDRSLVILQNLFRKAWSIEKNKNVDNYNILFPNGIQDEIQWGEESLQLLYNYWQKENPTTISRPNPVQREVWVSAKLSSSTTTTTTTTLQQVDNNDNDTTSNDSNNDNNDNSNDTILVRGIIDRLDMIRDNDNNNNNEISLQLIDYKTGKAPELKYSNDCNERIQYDAFEQLLIYAMLLNEKRKINKQSNNNNNNYYYYWQQQQEQYQLPLRYLRLFYLTSHNHNNNSDNDHDNNTELSSSSAAVYWDMDIGETNNEREIILNDVKQRVLQTWDNIRTIINKQDTKAFIGCNRTFCYCHKCRIQFIPNTIWQPITTITTSSDH